MPELPGRLERTPSALAAAMQGYSNDALARRPAATEWSPTEIICHLRDVDELFQIRFHTILALDEPRILVLGADGKDLAAWGIGGVVPHPLDPNQWGVTLLSGLTAEQWERGGIHLRHGRLTLRQWVESLANHDDNHLDQLRRALEGRPWLI